MLQSSRRHPSGTRRCAAVAIGCVVCAVLLTPGAAWGQQKLNPFAKSDRKKPAAKEMLPPKEAAQACLATADELATNGHRREAITLYERARQLDPKQTQVSRVLAVLYDLERREKEAMAEYGLALELTPEDPHLLNDVGYFYYQRRDFAAAEQWLRKAIVANPQHEHAHTNLGLTLGALGRFQESFEAFASVQPPAVAHSNVGMMLAKYGRREEAQKAFETALKLDPTIKTADAALAYLAGRPRPQTVVARHSPTDRHAELRSNTGLRSSTR